MSQKEIGRIGQLRYGQNGYGSIFFEEFLPNLRGVKGVQVFTEMAENDATVGAILFAIEMLMRNVDFKIEPGGGTDKDKKCAEFVESCMDDMESTWADTLSEIISFLTYGWSYHEIVYKRRVGKTESPITNSKYNDGLIGWRKLPIRAQDTLYGWEYKDDTDELVGMTQSPPPTYGQITIPLERALHFRTRSRKDNPEGRSILRTAYRCFDEETEILTRAGWKKHTDLTDRDEYATLNPGTLKLEYQPASELNRYNHEGKMIRFTSKFLDVMVTEGHRMWVRPDKAGKYRIVESQDVSARSSFMRFADWEGKEQNVHTIQEFKVVQKYVNGETGVKETKPTVDIDMDTWLKFLGWYLSEGCSWRRKDGNKQCVVMITQKDFARCDEIREVLAGMPYHVYEHKAEGKINFEISSVQLYEEMKKYGKSYEKYVPDYVKNLSARQIKIFLDAYVAGDGAIVGNTNGYSGTPMICTVSRRMADDLQELALKAGYESQIRTQKPRGRSKRDTYFVSLSKRREHKAKKTVEQYNGAVWCPTTENGIVYVRRNGKPVWVGNCYYFKKRLEEIEGYGIERDLAGFPVLYSPPDLPIWDEDDDMRKTLSRAEHIVSTIRRDAREGLVLPGGENGWKLELVTSGSRRQFDTNAIIDRYDKRIATSVLADFVMLGQQQVGSFALADSKTKIFALAIGTYLDVICEVFNNQGIPRLININGKAFEGITDYPKMTHGDIDEQDLAQFASYVKEMIGAGVIVPDEALEEEVRRVGGLPEKTETAAPREVQPGENAPQKPAEAAQRAQNPKQEETPVDDEQDAREAEEAKKSLGRKFWG